MKYRRYLIFILSALLFSALVSLNCDGCDDDDDDDDSQAKDCDTFCSRIADCSVGDELNISSMEECLNYCEADADDLVDCILQAENCDQVRECIGAGDDDDDTGPPDTFSCAALGLSEVEFTDTTDDDALYATAADFTVDTLRGEWNLKTEWTGCDATLIIQDKPSQTSGWPIPLWDRDVEDLIGRLPENTRLMFISNLSDKDDRKEALVALKELVDEALDELPQADQDSFYHRIHYITDWSKGLDGWLGDIMTSPGWGVGIDRFQRVRYIGSYADPGRFDGSQNWFAPNLSMAANEAIYYNFEAERQQELEADDATVIEIFDGMAFSGTERRDVTLPTPAALADFDTMKLDLYLGCDGDGEFGTCPAWDYIVTLYLCDAGDPETCTTEFGRWITTYHREGRWVHDISGLLPLIADGGLRRFSFYTQQRYNVKMDLRLSNAGRSKAPAQSVFLFSGGSFGPTYNDKYDPVLVAIPADATKVELATMITGHGGADPGNCAEFCDTTHHFSVNGNEQVLNFPEAGTRWDCQDKVDQGTVPNQYGTWWFGRSGWCPGKEVPLVMTDVTADVTPGQDATFEYSGFYNDEPYPSGGASIVMSSWVVISK